MRNIYYIEKKQVTKVMYTLWDPIELSVVNLSNMNKTEYRTKGVLKNFVKEMIGNTNWLSRLYPNLEEFEKQINILKRLLIIEVSELYKYEEEYSFKIKGVNAYE